MKSYSEQGMRADFEVRYRFLAPEEGGRHGPPLQHIRWDFLYEGDDPQRDGVWAIYPEFVDDSGKPRPEGPVPYQGNAYMFILNPTMRVEVHRRRVHVGAKGYMVEGGKKVSECEVTRVLALYADAGS